MCARRHHNFSKQILLADVRTIYVSLCMPRQERLKFDREMKLRRM